MSDPPFPFQETQISFGDWTPFPPQRPGSDLPSNISVEEMKRIYGLLDRGRTHSDLRAIAEQMLTGEGHRLSSLQPLIKPLIRPARHPWRERQVAAWILGRASLEPAQRDFAVNALIEVVEGKLEPEVQDRIKVSLTWALLPSLFMIPMLLAGSTEGGAVEFVGPLISMYFIVFFPLMLALARIRDRRGSNQICAEALNSLGRLQATQSLPQVAAAAVFGSRNGRRRKVRRIIQYAAQSALLPILVTLTPEHYGQIPSETLVHLGRLLRESDERLVVAILNAFAHVGNNLALQEVERLASGQGRASRSPRIQEAAQYALPHIQTRIARQNEPRTLLRGSAIPQTPQEQLLRPIQDAENSHPMEMLRASADPAWKGTEQEVVLVLHILQHLKEKGDARALPFVEQLAESTTTDSRVSRAALDCLPVLRAHQELERYSPTLLPSMNLQNNQ